MRHIALSLLAFASIVGCQSEPTPAVVVYTSVDDVFARPVTERFEQHTGIDVQLVTDTEETKSTGLLNRLIAEKGRPRADVFWSGDPVRAAILKRYGISAAYHPGDPADTQGRFSDPEGYWSALSSRARVFLYNANLIPTGQEPRSLQDLIDPRWKGRACLANPLFGTTSMHAAALFEAMGEDAAKEFFNAMRANDVQLLSSNGEVKRRVGAGECTFGLTDTDDAHVAMSEGKPVRMVYPDAQGSGTLIVPNAAVLIANGPNPQNARRFIDYLMSAEVERALAESDAAQMPLRPGVPVPAGVDHVDEIKAMPVDYGKLAARLDALSRGWLKDWTNTMAN